MFTDIKINDREHKDKDMSLKVTWDRDFENEVECSNGTTEAKWHEQEKSQKYDLTHFEYET
jgi:hypothetical protein